MSSEHIQVRRKILALKTEDGYAVSALSSPTAVDALVEWHLAQLQAAKAEARSKHIAEMQAYIVDPAIDDELGTVDYKVVAEKVFDYIENALTTPKEDKETE